MTSAEVVKVASYIALSLSLLDTCHKYSPLRGLIFPHFSFPLSPPLSSLLSFQPDWRDWIARADRCLASSLLINSDHAIRILLRPRDKSDCSDVSGRPAKLGEIVVVAQRDKRTGMKIPDLPESAREKIHPLSGSGTSIAEERERKKKKKKKENRGQIAVSAAGSSVRLFAAEDGCLWKDQKQFAGWRLRIGARGSLSRGSLPFRLLSAPLIHFRRRSRDGSSNSFDERHRDASATAAAGFYSAPQFRLNKASCASADIFPSA